jgi:hypothetical protein
MGFLNDLLNPVKHFQDAKHGIKSLASGDIKGALDPSGHILGGSSPKTPPQAVAGPQEMDPSLYGGDASDPAYGSLLEGFSGDITKPFGVEEFYNYQDPGYAFRLQQGNQALQNSAAAGSGAMSGAALKDLLGYNQDMASQEYGNAFNRYQTEYNRSFDQRNIEQGNIFSRLSSIANLGQNAAAGVGQQGTALAGNAGQMLSNAGAAEGAGIVGAGNAIGQGASNYWLMRQMGQPPPPAVGGV